MQLYRMRIVDRPEFSILACSLSLYAFHLITPTDGIYMIRVPDMDIDTQGNDLTDAIEMARDAIGLKGITLEDMGKMLPEPSDLSEVEHGDRDIVTLVDVDFMSYRSELDNKMVRKNLTIPSWLNKKAERAWVNFSKVLQEALINALDA